MLNESEPERLSAGLAENTTPDVKSLAFFLPQFHPTPENNEWWGEGFTEWRNVVKTSPRFDGHYQPRLPADLGYYDLRLIESRIEQQELARDHAIDGFVYYHYWFNGRRMLERPVDDILRHDELTMPFSLCWANESWSNTWGPTEGSKSGETRMLVEQTYSHEDDLSHIRYLSQFFADERYITQDGKPLFLVYRAHQLPDPERTLDTWRHEASRLGVGALHICAVQNAFFDDELQDPTLLGFDAAVEFQPDSRHREPIQPENGQASSEKVYDYRTAVDMSLAQELPSYERYPCVMPNWDNSPRRREGATIYVNSTPEEYGRWILETLLKYQRSRADASLLFVNSWNEWAEGSPLEPDERWGKAYLEAHRKAISAFGAIVCKPMPLPSSWCEVPIELNNVIL